MPAPMTTTLLSRGLPALAIIAAAGVAGVFGLVQMRTSAERDVYRDRLRTITTEFDQLAAQYNRAVRQTAITELVVEDGRLSVVVRNGAGETETTQTPYDPSGEIFVDYAVIDGRVWIRRVFDQHTPPANALVLDPRLVTIDWNAPGADLGKTVYRSLGEGRWVISVSGSGALGLTRSEKNQPVPLAPPPEITAFAEVEREAERASEQVGFLEMLTRAVGG
jgi:hypothetical protein